MKPLIVIEQLDIGYHVQLHTGATQWVDSPMGRTLIPAPPQRFAAATLAEIVPLLEGAFKDPVFAVQALGVRKVPPASPWPGPRFTPGGFEQSWPRKKEGE